MTAAARITQADMERAARAVKAAGFDQARIVMDLAKCRIEVILGAQASAPAAPHNPWDDE